MEIKKVLYKLTFPAFITAYLLLAAFCLYDYINLLSAQGCMGVAAFLLSLQLQPAKEKRFLFAWLTIALAMLSVWLPVKTVLYACIVAAAFFAVESFKGRLPFLSLLALALTSPIFDYVVNVFSFPIRLWLTGLAGRMLAIVGKAVVEGNVIVYNGATFSVDPACMGLHMLVTSLIATVILVAVFQKKYRLMLSWPWLVTLLAAVVLLNIAGNFLRILCLVFFALPPESVMHDIMGLFCWSLYVLAPAACLSAWLIRKRGTLLSAAPEPLKNKTGSIWQNAIIAGLVVCTAVAGLAKAGAALPKVALTTMQGYSVKQLPGAVTQLQNKEVLIYLKGITGFYASEHHPMICWKGSGYEFRTVKVAKAPMHEVYTAQLQKNDEKLYTTWWYTNGNQSTISQWQWRWDLIRGGDNYTLVNITATSEAILQKYLDFSL